MNIDDMYTSDGKIRADGLLEHEMYITQVKMPAESKHRSDYFKLELSRSPRAINVNVKNCSGSPGRFASPP